MDGNHGTVLLQSAIPLTEAGAGAAIIMPTVGGTAGSIRI
jgi:hypothetical protein